MTPYASWLELQSRWRTLTTVERLKADILLADASRMITRLYPDVPARIAADASFAQDVVMIVCNMVRRTMLRETTEGVQEFTDQRGPYRITRRFANPSGDLDFTAREEAILEGTAVATTAAVPVWKE